MASNRRLGVYVMQVASVLTGMHPQTLRKYERAGFLAPARRYAVRLYSDEDIARLRMIKHLVDDGGLNLAGVGLALRLRDMILGMRREIASAEMRSGLRRHLTGLLDEMLRMLGS
jgi:MerR family transcriptional regulator/heat shock protein HspR